MDELHEHKGQQIRIEKLCWKNYPCTMAYAYVGNTKLGPFPYRAIKARRGQAPTKSALTHAIEFINFQR